MLLLKDAAQAVLDRWNSPKWEWDKQGPTADLMHVLHAAIEQPAPHNLQKRLADLHLYEEIAEHYAKCAVSPEALRDWVVEQIDSQAVAWRTRAIAGEWIFCSKASYDFSVEDGLDAQQLYVKPATPKATS